MVFLGSSFVNALVDVLAIIGIILVGGFLIFFLGDLVLSVLDPNYKRFGKKDRTEKTEEKEETKQVQQLPTVEKEVEVLDYQPVEPVYEPEEDVNHVKEIEQAKEDALADLRAEEEAFKASVLKEIEERQAKKAEAEKAQEEPEEEGKYDEFFLEDEDLEAFDDEAEDFNFEPEEVGEPEEVVEEPVEEPVEEIPEEPVVEATEEELATPVTNDELEALKRELDEQRRKFEEEKAALVSANEELAKKLAENEEEENGPVGSLDEYEARLETLKQRLAANDKELRKVKKEFLPLKRVAKTLESDEKKLRRKEAIVAKQKVVLYGVNNIGEIDEEKAKKLEEDLDILEGFRLSVQHCQEVMDANKERYPILEKTYNILTENNETLKKDIQEVEANIAALKASEDGTQN